MKKNTLFVSVLAGIGTFVALFAVFSTNNTAQYKSRIGAEVENQGRVDSYFFDMMRKNVTTGKVESADYLKAVEESKRFENSRAGDLDWEFFGPDNVGGRVRGIIVDNQDPDLVYAGGAGGGMYVSTNAAGTWTYKSDGWENIHVSHIAQDGNGRVYAGTGNYADDYPGGGIWVSDDRGDTWSRLSSTIPSALSPSADWSYVNKIAIGKTKNSSGNYTVYAGTRKGLKVSEDNGATWTMPMTQANCSTPYQANIMDVVTTDNGRVFVSYSGGQLYISDAGETNCSYNRVPAANGISSSTRMSIAVCPSDENTVYAFQAWSGSPSGTFKIITSTDAGMNWSDLTPAPPTAVIDSTFDLMGINPVNYNQAIGVDPNNCNSIYVGAVSMYRVDGAWTSVAFNFGDGPFSVHSDKHRFSYSPHDPKLMYVGTDGGVSKTENAAAGTVTWSQNNRHFGTTQYYGLATTPTGQIIGGTQDNGTHLIDPKNGAAGKDGKSVFGGDGFDCESSDIGDVSFTTLYYGQVGRGTYKDGGTFATTIHPGGEDASTSPFKTVIREWESINDLTSKDSVLFANDTIRYSIGAGDGNKKVYTGSLRKPQESAVIVGGQVRFSDELGGQVADDVDQLGVLKSFGDSVGSIDYVTGEYSIRWSFAPPNKSKVNSLFNVEYNAGDTIVLTSQNEGITFNYVLPSAVVVNDSLTIQDPVQSLLAVSMAGGLNLTREALYLPREIPAWKTYSLGSSNTPTCFEFSNDGNHLYVGTYSGNVIRVSNLNEFYSDSTADSVLIQSTIFNSGPAVSGISLHPTDPNLLLVTTGGYGTGQHVYELTAAESSTGTSPRRNLQGDLPDFPVYDPEYNVNNTDQVLIGTELGLWVSDDISGTPSWSKQSGAMGNVPVLDVIQQRLSYSDATNYGRFYLGTFGRGIWSTGDLVSVEEPWKDYSSNSNFNNIETYPNPVVTTSKLSFETPNDGAVSILIYDISGKLVKSSQQYFAKGTAEYEIKANNLDAGTYFVTMQMGSVEGYSSFVVIK